jgi:hypothetical protein
MAMGKKIESRETAGSHSGVAQESCCLDVRPCLFSSRHDVIPTKNESAYEDMVNTLLHVKGKKGKSVPLQAWSGPQGTRKLRFPDYVTMAQNGSKVVSLTHRPLFTPRKYSWYSFLLEAE